MQQSKPDVRVNIVVDPDRFDTVVGELIEAGAQVEERSPAIGMVCTRIAAGGVPAVEAIDGVQAVEQDRTIHLPPPEADLQ
ncbi:hypothetical protein [Nonomuraea dietziae]|uniref:hypothetical protein n=1 Tax=Nonomuraea dietziae TaxID=65515 RepID=UPI00343F7B84